MEKSFKNTSTYYFYVERKFALRQDRLYYYIPDDCKGERSAMVRAIAFLYFHGMHEWGQSF